MFHILILSRQRDMINITAGKNVESEWDNQGNAHLTLKNVKPSDGGLYYCVAYSRSGRAKCSAYLHVKGKFTPVDMGCCFFNSFIPKAGLGSKILVSSTATFLVLIYAPIEKKGHHFEHLGNIKTKKFRNWFKKFGSN